MRNVLKLVILAFSAFVGVLFFLAFITISVPNDSGPNDLQDELASLVPHVLRSASIDFASNLTVKYHGLVQSGISTQPVMPASTTFIPPEVAWNAQKGAFYTLIMIDPLALQRTRSISHWVVVNIPGNNLALGEHIQPYIGMAPYFGTGIHHIVLLLYKQPHGRKLKIKDMSFFPSRVIGDVLSETNKFGLGHPVDLVQFDVEWDKGVDTAHAATKLNPPEGMRSPSQMIYNEGIVPDLIPLIHSHPCEYITVTYPGIPSFSKDKKFVPASETVAEPELKWDIEHNAKYTLLMLQPTYIPGKEWHKHFVHWVVKDIPGNHVKDGHAVVPYIGGCTLYGTGVHRIVFLVYKQIENGNLGQLRRFSEPGRFGRTAKEFYIALRNSNLTNLVALAVFETEWDPSVNQMHQSIGFKPFGKFVPPAGLIMRRATSTTTTNLPGSGTQPPSVPLPKPRKVVVEEKLIYPISEAFAEKYAKKFEDKNIDLCGVASLTSTSLRDRLLLDPNHQSVTNKSKWKAITPFNLLKQTKTFRDFLPFMKVPPQQFINVTYPLTRMFWHAPMSLSVCRTQRRPRVQWSFAEDSMYTLTVLDLDNPSSGARNHFDNRVHWMVVNIPKNDVHRGDTIHEYSGPKPFFNSGYHRLVFLIYRQPNGRVDVTRNKTSGRLSVPRTKKGLGDPVAVSICLVYWDASVDIMMVRNKQLGILPRFISPFQMLVMTKVFPEIIPSIQTHPSQFLHVTYPEGHEFSNTVPFIPARVTSGTPDISWTHKAGAFYTAMMIDPDFLGYRGPENRTYLHWIQTNIGDRILDQRSQLIMKPNREYVGVAAPHGTGRHRYIILLFEHKDRIAPGQGQSIFTDDWAGVNLTHVINQLQLGDPIALAVFMSEWDDSVDLIHRSINWFPPPKFRSQGQKNRAEGIYD